MTTALEAKLQVEAVKFKNTVNLQHRPEEERKYSGQYTYSEIKAKTEIRMLPFCPTLFLYRHSSPCTLVTFRKIRRKSNFAQVGTEYRPTYGQLYICKPQAVQLKSSFQHAKTLSTSARSARRLCYRPAVFFHHFLLNALSITQETFRQRI